jgi:hypothetical protein
MTDFLGLCEVVQSVRWGEIPIRRITIRRRGATAAVGGDAVDVAVLATELSAAGGAKAGVVEVVFASAEASCLDVGEGDRGFERE